jgi:hypothetical protein
LKLMRNLSSDDIDSIPFLEIWTFVINFGIQRKVWC